MQNAIYCKGTYLLLPEEFPDFEAFRKDLRSRTLPAEYSMVVLHENNRQKCFSVTKGVCMTPYFLSGYHDEPSRIRIADITDLYPVQVEILTQAQYNERLREVVNRVCPGCTSFKPLSNRVQSLNGHFDEISLDGVCVFRQETKPSPRSFHHHLFSFGGFFHHFHFDQKNAGEMQEEIKRWFYIRHADAVLESHNEDTVLTLRCKKNELLTPVITDCISRYLEQISEGTYHIHQSELFHCTQESLDLLLAQADSETFRKECKKTGTALAVLEYDPEATDSVRRSLEPLIDHFWIFPLVQTAGKDYYLLTETSTVLKELRYRSPLLQTHNAKISISGQNNTTSYVISFAMEQL